MTFTYTIIRRYIIPYSFCVYFIFPALPSVIQTATFLTAAGSIHLAQRLQWKPRGPVVKETLSSNMRICTLIHMQSHTQIGAHAHKLADSAGNWLTHFTNVLPDVLFKVFCHTNKRLIIWTTVSVCIFLHFLCCYRRRKQLFTHQLIHFFPPLFSPPACLSQEASPRRTPLCVTIMASAARRKCSG